MFIRPSVKRTFQSTPICFFLLLTALSTSTRPPCLPQSGQWGARQQRSVQACRRRARGLQDSEGWISLTDDAGAELLPVWPHERYAQLFSTDRYPTAMALPIPLDEWLDNWLSNLEEDSCQLAVFPTPAGTGAVVEAARMRTDLEAELENYA